MIIDYTYFDNVFTRIPGINAYDRGGDPTESARNIRADIETLTRQYAPAFLSALLGDAWATLKDRPEVLSLLRNEEQRTSPLAKYVWCKWAQLQATRTTAAGEKVKQGEFSSNANAVWRIVQVWNSMVDDCAVIVATLADSTAVDIAPNLQSEIFERQNIFGI
jgi:hypothetical protein